MNEQSRTFSRRSFIKTGVSSAVGLTAARALGDLLPPGGPRPKNVLFLMTDEHNIRYFSGNGHRQALTPTLDRLMKEGVYFENAHCAYPVCTASRCSLHTGMWAHTHGQNLNIDAPDNNLPGLHGLAADTHLMATSFHERGFFTTHRGKWHCGDVRRHPCYNWNPTNNDENAGWRAWVSDWYKSNPVPKGLPPSALYDAPPFPIYGIPGMKEFNATKLPYRAGRTTLPLEAERNYYWSQLALSDIRQAGNRPFMITMSDSGPHGPHTVMDPYYSAVDPGAIPLPVNHFRPEQCAGDPSCRAYDKLHELCGGEAGWREYLRCYTAMIRKIDWQFGNLIGELDKRGDLDDTLVVFTADHGDMCCAHQTAGGKAVWEFYDEIARVPLIMRWPRGIPAGKRIRTFANGVDLMPTILDYMGLPVPAQCQGQSLRRYIEGGEELDRPGFCEATHPIANVARRMVRTHEWALWFYCAGKPDATFAQTRHDDALRHGQRSGPGKESFRKSKICFRSEDAH